jgi:transcriptional regulator
MPDSRADLLPGTVEMLALTTLAVEPMHGWGIAQRIQELSRDGLVVPQGSLYPALQRMKRRGWIVSGWRTTENNRRARYYTLTAAGRRQLEIERVSWQRAAAAVNWVLSANLLPEPA